MVEIKQLRQLVTIADCGTMTAAAKKLYLSQPALSRSMQRLESALSVNLFDHGQNSARLNETGRLAVERAEELLRQIDALPEQLRAFARSLKTISIGAVTGADRGAAPLLSGNDRRVRHDGAGGAALRLAGGSVSTDPR